MTELPRQDLTAEETFLWACARSWRRPEDVVVPPSLDWARVVAVAQDNRMQTLLARLLAERGLLECLPHDSRAALLADAARIPDEQLCVAEAFVRFAQGQRFSFWRGE